MSKEYYQILWQCFSEGLLIRWTFIQIMPEILPTWIATDLVVVNSSCGELQVVVNYSNIGRTTSCWRWSQGALPPYTHPPTRPSRCDYRLQRSTHVITGPAPTSAGLVWLHLQHFHWSHVRGLKIHNIRANRPHNTARWLQEGVKWLITAVKLLITEGRWSIVGLDWRVYDLISKEVWSEIIAHSQGYQSNFRMTTRRLYFLMTTRKWGRYQNYFRWVL